MDLQRIANLIGDEGFEADRGVIHLMNGDFLVFGNDGFENSRDQRSEREVESIRKQIAGRADELGFGKSGDGYSWALLVRFHSPCVSEAGLELCRNVLTLALWQGWTGTDERPDGEGFESLQDGIAEAVIKRIRLKILALLN